MSSAATVEGGTIPKKIKVNGDSALTDCARTGVTYSEADSSCETTKHPNSVFADENLQEMPSRNGVVEGDNVGAINDYGDPEPSNSSGSKGEPLKSILDYVEPQYVDEKTHHQMESIENEIKDHVKLIAPKENLEVLEEEYSDPVYIQKIVDLQTKYRWLRRTRGDGNCFYRSLGFSIFENFMNAGSEEKLDKFKRFMLECKDGLVALKYPAFTMEDFVDSFNEQISRVLTNPTELELLDIFESQGSSDFVVVWLRFLTVLQLLRDPDFYGNFIENHASVADFCRNEVEPMFRESDHIHIIAVATLLGMKIRVEYMDRGGSPTVISHDFPESEADPEVFMLYRPGHYDILYRL